MRRIALLISMMFALATIGWAQAGGAGAAGGASGAGVGGHASGSMPASGAATSGGGYAGAQASTPAGDVGAQTSTQTQSQTTTPDQNATQATSSDQNVTPAVPNSDQGFSAGSMDQQTVSQTLIQHERDSWNNAQSKNVQYFKQGLPGDVTADLPSGKVEHKSKIESNVKKDSLSNFSLSNFNVTYPSPDQAQVTYTASFSGTRKDGKAFNQTRNVTSIWQLKNGTWENERVDIH